MLNIHVLIDPAIESDPELDPDLFIRGAAAAAKQRGFDCGEINVRATDDETICVINRDHLGHDYPTDVISFGYVARPPRIEADIVVSLDTARTQAKFADWPTRNELLLYVVHGTLHATGMDDHSAEDRAAMRTAESKAFGSLGLSCPNVDRVVS